LLRARVQYDRIAVAAGRGAAVEGVGFADVDDEELNFVAVARVELLQPTG
jgi:hypothetical protein